MIQTTKARCNDACSGVESQSMRAPMTRCMASGEVLFSSRNTAAVRAGVKLVRIGRSETGALAGYEDDMGGVFQRQSRRHPLFGGVAIEAGVSGFGLIAHAIAATFDDDGLGVVE